MLAQLSNSTRQHSSGTMTARFASLPRRPGPAVSFKTSGDASEKNERSLASPAASAGIPKRPLQRKRRCPARPRDSAQDCYPRYGPSAGHRLPERALVKHFGCRKDCSPISPLRPSEAAPAASWTGFGSTWRIARLVGRRETSSRRLRAWRWHREHAAYGAFASSQRIRSIGSRAVSECGKPQRTSIFFCIAK